MLKFWRKFFSLLLIGLTVIAMFNTLLPDGISPSRMRTILFTSPSVPKATEKKEVTNSTTQDGNAIKQTVFTGYSEELAEVKELFQPVDDINTFVFSAFFDTLNGENLVRVFGIQSCRKLLPIVCHLSERGVVHMSNGTVELLSNHHLKSHCVVNFKCVLTTTFRPDSVSLTFSIADAPTNHLQVSYPRPSIRNFTVCYAVLFRYLNHAQLIQNIEYNRALGAEHFFVYNLSVSRTVDSVLRQYQRLGLLTVVQWTLPRLQLPYFGQLLAINDCVYRNRNVSKYVAVHDTDEFITPTYHNTFQELIDEIDEEYYKQSGEDLGALRPLGTYVFQHYLFNRRPNITTGESQGFCPASPEEDRLFQRYSIGLFTHLQRFDVPAFYNRTKVIVRPDLIVYSEVHFSKTHRPLVSSADVSPRLAKLHHLRDWSELPEGVVDITSCRFKDKVLPMVSDVYSKLDIV